MRSENDHCGSNETESEPRGPVPPVTRSWWPYPPDSEELGRAQQVFVICSLLVWFVAGLAVTIYAFVPSSNGVSAWCIGLAAMSATFLAGGLMGFLFALPRSEKAKVHIRSEQSEQRVYVRPNTNLEDVSDWLTKIVVGLTLVQLNKIPGLAAGLFNWVGSGLGTGQSSVVFAGSLIVYSSAAGLMQSWIATRLFIIQWMAESDEKRDEISSRTVAHGEIEQAQEGGQGRAPTPQAP